MPAITFKGKAYKLRRLLSNGDIDLVSTNVVDVPKIKRHHCDMPAFRNHKKFGVFANSDMFESMLARAIKPLGARIDCDNPPAGVNVDCSGFLTVVSIETDAIA